MKSLFQRLRRFAREDKGVAALEFAIIAPLLMVPLLLGSVDLIDAMMWRSMAKADLSDYAGARIDAGGGSPCPYPCPWPHTTTIWWSAG